MTTLRTQRVDSIQSRDIRPTRDESIAQTVRDRLQQSPYWAVRQLTCDFREGVAIVRGNVPTYHTRQIAVSTVQGVNGVKVVDDKIQVTHEPRKSK